MNGLANTDIRYFHHDRLGSVVALSDENGVVAANDRYVTSPWGEGPEINPGGSPYRFTGRRYDPETGLYYYRARYYNPRLGRFLQVDPIGYEQSINLYQYAGNDPLGRVDPSGAFWLEVGIAAAAASTIDFWGQVYSNTQAGRSQLGDMSFDVGQNAQSAATAAAQAAAVQWLARAASITGTPGPGQPNTPVYRYKAELMFPDGFDQTPYGTIDEALENIIAPTDVEIGGFIFKNSDGTYRHGAWYRGSKNGIGLDRVYNNMSPQMQAEVAGAWHTHPVVQGFSEADVGWFNNGLNLGVSSAERRPFYVVYSRPHRVMSLPYSSSHEFHPTLSCGGIKALCGRLVHGQQLVISGGQAWVRP